MKFRRLMFTLGASLSALVAGSFCSNAATVEGLVDVAPVWAGHPVGFSLLTDGQDQFVAFYDAERQMTVGQRKLPETAWRFVQLPETLNWDSHNSVTMALDSTGRIHLSGNMHVKPLVYFRTREPRDIGTFERISSMVEKDEQRVTYPHFFQGPGGALVFTYRDGSSGSGNQIYNTYDPATASWRRLLDKPLLDGEGLMNAYLHGPVPGPDGYYHLCWVWRDTGDCATNHDLSYARSKDLVHWETSTGAPLALPITLATGEIVDPVPAGGGIINVNETIGFDSRKRPILSYHKYDERGNTQVYNARLEDGHWVVHQASHWDYRWDFHGGGTIVVEIHVFPVKEVPGIGLVQRYSHVQYGTGEWLLDEETLDAVKELHYKDPLPKALRAVTSSFPGMGVHWSPDLGASGSSGNYYMLRWETLGANRDKPREPPLPKPSMLQVVHLGP